MAEPQNDWIIEDSEEEDQLCAPERDPAPPAEDAVSSIQSFTPTVIKSVHETSHISSLDCAPPAQHIAPPFPPQAEHSTISEYSIKSDPKPRPRPIFSHPNTNPTANTSTSDPILPYTPASDREQPTIVAHSDPTGIESISGNTTSAPIDFSQDIAERAKMRTRKAAKRLHLRSTQYPEDIIDITDDELAIAPTRKPKERPKPRPVKRPNRDHPPLPSDAVTVPVLSSSMSLPPSDPFPDSTVLDHTPPPPGLDEAAVSTSSPRQSPSRKGKRKRQGHLQSPIYHGPTDSNPFPSAPGGASSPQSDPPRPARMSDTMPDNHDAKGSDDEAGADESPKRPKNPKGTEGSSPGRSAIGKPKKKSIVEVVILSPKKKNKNKKTEASGDTSKLRKGSKSRNRRLVSSDEEDDELMLAPQSNSSTVAKSRNGKKTKLQVEDERPSTEIAASSSQIVMGKEQHEHRQGAAPISDIDGQDKAMSRSDERTTATPLKENAIPSGSVRGKDPPQPSPTRETPNRGKLRYTFSSLDRKTPMQELIRRAASHPHTPFSATSSPIASPLAKTSKSALRRIAPLHPTRRTPPPPPPPPPPPKKSKKMLQLEEKWELELEDEVEGWWALTDEERRDWRKAKRDKELGFDD